MMETATGQSGLGIAPQGRWLPDRDQPAIPHGLPVANPVDPDDRRRFVDAPPLPATDTWHAVPEWATWLALALGLSIVAMLLGAIVLLLG